MAEQGCRRKRSRTMLAVLALAGAAVACTSSSASTTAGLGLYLYPDHSGAIQSNIDNCNKQANGAYKITYNVLPAAADGQRQQLVRRLAAKDKALDIVGMGVNWAPEFAQDGWVREWTGALKDQVTADTLPAAIQTGTWLGKLYGAPWNSNTQLLWYRKDLVPKPPQTWDEMITKIGK